MKDVRPMAEERARNRAGENPSGNGFVTERARAKEALREEVSTYTGENVRKIAASTETAQDDRILRVAAYELWHTQDTPDAVVINEAVALAQRFDSPTAAKFVNGVLATLLAERDQGENA